MPWYKNWFDSPYYHILYRHRDEKEAELFLDNIISLLHPPPSARILDLGCGKGRHCVLLNKKGFDVTGLDLSPSSISFAEKHCNDRLNFYQHDIRKPCRINYYDIALNLFTSFGYCKKESENREVLRSAFKSLKSGGKFVLDFMNSKKVLSTLVGDETLNEEGIFFRLKRSAENGFIIKNIEVEDAGKKSCYTEEVRAYTIPEIESLLRETGFNILHLYGDYGLNLFREPESERAIFVSVKG